MSDDSEDKSVSSLDLLFRGLTKVFRPAPAPNRGGAATRAGATPAVSFGGKPLRKGSCCIAKRSGQK